MSELGDRSIDILQTEKPKGKKMNRIRKKCRVALNRATYTEWEYQDRRERKEKKKYLKE